MTDDLSTAASEGLEQEPTQIGDELPGTNFTKVSIEKAAWAAPEGEKFEIGMTGTVTMNVRCRKNGQEEMADGHVRDVVTFVASNVSFQQTP